MSQDSNMFSSNYFQQRMEKMASRTTAPSTKPGNTSILPKRVFSPLKINPALFNQKILFKNEEKENIARINRFSDLSNSQTQALRQNFSTCSGLSYNHTFNHQRSLDNKNFERKINKNELFDEIKKNLGQYLTKEFNNFKNKIVFSKIINQTHYEQIIKNVRFY